MTGLKNKGAVVLKAPRRGLALVQLTDDAAQAAPPPGNSIDRKSLVRRLPSSPIRKGVSGPFLSAAASVKSTGAQGFVAVERSDVYKQIEYPIFGRSILQASSMTQSPMRRPMTAPFSAAPRFRGGPNSGTPAKQPTSCRFTESITSIPRRAPLRGAYVQVVPQGRLAPAGGLTLVVDAKAVLPSWSSSNGGSASPAASDAPVMSPVATAPPLDARAPPASPSATEVPW